MRSHLFAGTLVAVMTGWAIAPMIASPLPATASRLIAQAASPEEQFSEATFLLQQGIEQIGSGEFQVALESFDQVIAVSRDSAVRETLPDDARQLEGIALVARGKALLELGDSAQASESIQQGMTIAQELNDPELEALAQQMLSEVDAP